MSNRSKSVYASNPFKFIVDGEPLYIHADLVSLHSKPLDRMINGHPAEAQKGFATLEDVNESTFVRFIEWAHKGYYTAPDFTTVEVEMPSIPAPPQEEIGFEPEDEPPPTPEPSHEWASLSSLPSKKGKKTKRVIENAWGVQIMDDNWARDETLQEVKGRLKEAFISRRYTIRQGVIKIPPPRPNRGPEEDYTDVFLSHAQLYVFAEKYDIQPLKTLALEELHATLAIYTLYPARTGDIITLIRYAYSNTGESDKGKEDLRKVLTIYIGYEMETLMDDEDFKHLMFEDGGPLLGDFMTMVRKRISRAPSVSGLA